jgi:hypothetical protein
MVPFGLDAVLLTTGSASDNGTDRADSYRGTLRSRTYRVSIKFIPDYKHLLQENYVKYNLLPKKMEQIECSETSEIINQTPGNHPKEDILYKYIILQLRHFPTRWCTSTLGFTCSSLFACSISKQVGWERWSDTPLDFFVWGYVTDKVFSTPVPDITNLKARITHAFCYNN